jgi:hypothetical protein
MHKIYDIYRIYRYNIYNSVNNKGRKIHNIVDNQAYIRKDKKKIKQSIEPDPDESPLP